MLHIPKGYTEIQIRVSALNLTRRLWLLEQNTRYRPHFFKTGRIAARRRKYHGTAGAAAVQAFKDNYVSCHATQPLEVSVAICISGDNGPSLKCFHCYLRHDGILQYQVLPVQRVRFRALSHHFHQTQCVPRKAPQHSLTAAIADFSIQM